MVYSGLFFFTLILSFFSLARDFEKKLWFFFLFFIIFCIVALRYKSANDYFSYWNLYDKVVNTSGFDLFTYKFYPTGDVESGFAFLAFIEKFFYGHYFVFVAIYSFVDIYIKYRAIKELSPYIILSALLYVSLCIFGDIGEIRQRMACGIVLYSVIFAYKRQLRQFLITIFVAITMHNSALIGITLYFIPYISRPIILWSALILSVVIAVKGGIGIPLLTAIGTVIGVEESSRLVLYTTISKYLNAFKLFGGTFIFQLLLSVLMLCFYKQLVNKWSYNKILIPMYIYGSVLMFSFIDYGIIAYRIGSLFCSYSSLIIIPSFLFLFKKKERFVPYLLIIGYCFIWFIAINRTHSPYESILQFLL
jgi:hypothetical protein